MAASVSVKQFNLFHEKKRNLKVRKARPPPKKSSNQNLKNFITREGSGQK